MKTKIMIILLASSFMASCHNSDFKQTKASDPGILSERAKEQLAIRSFNLRYNPKANGTIILKLEDGSEYEATSVDGGSFSAIALLLNDTNSSFDGKRREVFINR